MAKSGMDILVKIEILLRKFFGKLANNHIELMIRSLSYGYLELDETSKNGAFSSKSIYYTVISVLIMSVNINEFMIFS